VGLEGQAAARGTQSRCCPPSSGSDTRDIALQQGRERGGGDRRAGRSVARRNPDRMWCTACRSVIWKAEAFSQRPSVMRSSPSEYW